MKVLNLYSGIGGNRKLWKNVQVTAVEHNEEIAAIYSEYFPDDKMIVADAHDYLLKHYKEFDFIWSSAPCPEHGRPRFWASKGGRYEPEYPDMKLWQEIIFLKYFFDGKYVVENVIPYYDTFLTPTIEIDRHLFWSNFKIRPKELEKECTQTWLVTSNTIQYGFDLSDKKIDHRKDQILRNLVNPDLGLYILEQAQGIMRQEKTNQTSLFDAA